VALSRRPATRRPNSPSAEQIIKCHLESATAGKRYDVSAGTQGRARGGGIAGQALDRRRPCSKRRRIPHQGMLSERDERDDEGAREFDGGAIPRCPCRRPLARAAAYQAL